MVYFTYKRIGATEEFFSCTESSWQVASRLRDKFLVCQIITSHALEFVLLEALRFVSVLEEMYLIRDISIALFKSKNKIFKLKKRTKKNILKSEVYHSRSKPAGSPSWLHLSHHRLA